MSLSEEEKDAYHRTEDQKIIETIGDFDPSKRSMLPIALAVCREEDRLDIRSARDLLGNEPDLKVALEKAWIKKEFKDIRNRDILRLPSQIRETKEKSQSHKELVVKSAWNKGYTGEMHTLLFDNINAMNRRSTYSGFALIVQSSGTGKSRMVHEQAKLVFTLPFNLRNVFTVLKSFGKIYQLAAEQLSSLLNGGRMKRQELAECWYDSLQAKGNRSTLYEAALKGTKEYLLHSVSSCKNDGEDIKSKTKEWLVKLVGTITEHITDDVPDDQCVKVMLYFDEAHTLIPSSDQEPQINVLEVLQSCLADTHRRAHFALFLSTVSKLQDFAPVQHLANSARARAPGPLQAPITEVPFDCWSGLPICPHLYKLGDLSKIRFMARFGRPLYWALLNELVPDSEEIMLDLIRAKIVGRNVPEKLPPVEKQLKEIIVLLDVRLLLDYELYRDMTINHEANLVASHMRMNYSVPETREYLCSSYSSELGVQPKLPLGSGINSQVYKNLAKKTAPRAVQSVQIVERGSHSTAKRQKLDHLDTPSKIHVIKGGKICHHHDLHPRYNIFAYGCSSTVYNLLDPKNAMNVDEEDEGGQLAGFVVTGSMEDTDTSAYDDVFET
ncbi:hypothetical protein SERLADRAFT_415801 [Serpula lacrymans var. lacrymans S7.9]|uniref:Uncharacterized protein n=1 Tax=Serpula lacrymans var. lacrymans (strain S7.9) TaxID=578457 RepID=F8NVL8_SERL9|nr:uncharacterized protein SERLADRAFT_415801 [Serpula lacrymans var. lacrymans S7.9]EGO24856.1 hypothetical protein SERLADRAFT_415801 [Serpula lacrymans var. lacrymans S7.9]